MFIAVPSSPVDSSAYYADLGLGAIRDGGSLGGEDQSRLPSGCWGLGQGGGFSRLGQDLLGHEQDLVGRGQDLVGHGQDLVDGPKDGFGGRKGRFCPSLILFRPENGLFINQAKSDYQ